MNLYQVLNANWDKLNGGLKLKNEKLDKKMNAEVVINVKKTVNNEGVIEKNKGFLSSMWQFVRAAFSNKWEVAE